MLVLVLAERLELELVLEERVRRPVQEVVLVELALPQLRDRRLPSPLWHLRFSPWRLS